MSESVPVCYVRIWAQKNQVNVGIERKTSDKYLINKDGVFLLLPDGMQAAVNTRQVFPVVDRYPMISSDDLVLLGTSPTREFHFSVSRPGDRTAPKLFTFEHIRQEVESYLSLLMHLDSLQLYVAIRAYESGLVSLPHLTRVTGMLTPQQTLATLLLQQNLCSWEDLLAVCLDLKRSLKPAVSGAKSKPVPAPGAAESTRSTEFELCGEILVALGRVSRTQLERAVRAKTSGNQPLGAILIQMGACTQDDVDNAVRAQADMKSTEYGPVGLLGELLVEGGFVRHEDLHEALRMQKTARQRLDGILVSMGICTREQIQDYRWRCPGGLLPNGEVDEEKLAEYITMANLATPRELEEALRLQKRGRQLLGELLVNLKRCTDQDIQRALSEQKRRRLHKKKEPEKLGELLIAKKLVSEAAVERAAEIQRAGRERLGSTLINLGACTQDDFQKALQLQFSWRESAKSRDDKLGEELLREGFVTPANLNRALEVHSKAGKPLGQILVETGFCTPEIVIDTLVRRDERRRAAFAMLIQQHAPRFDPLSSKVRAYGANGMQPQGEKNGLVQKVSSWLFKKDEQA